MRLYLVTVISIAVLISFGSPTVRLLAGLLIAIGAIPAWQMMWRFFQRRFWHDVEIVIGASGGQPTEEQPSDRE